MLMPSSASTRRKASRADHLLAIAVEASPEADQGLLRAFAAMLAATLDEPHNEPKVPADAANFCEALTAVAPGLFGLDSSDPKAWPALGSVLRTLTPSDREIFIGYVRSGGLRWWQERGIVITHMILVKHLHNWVAQAKAVKKVETPINELER